MTLIPSVISSILPLPRSGDPTPPSEAGSAVISGVALPILAGMSTESFPSGIASRATLESDSVNAIRMYEKLLKDMPRSRRAATEVKIQKLSCDPEDVVSKISFIIALIADERFDLLPKDYYYYGLIAVKAGKMSWEQFSALSQALPRYVELTRRIPVEHIDAIETKMEELCRDAEEVERQISCIKAHLVDGKYELFPKDYYYYGLIAVKAEKMSVEQFSILVDHMTLEGREKTVSPLFIRSEEGHLILNESIADKILYTFSTTWNIPSKAEGYAFLESIFKDLPAEALQVQVFKPTKNPEPEIELPPGTDPSSFEAKIVKFHDNPLGCALHDRVKYNWFIYCKEGEEWRQLSVSAQMYQRFLDRIFMDNAVKLNIVLGDSSLEDIRKNGFTSTRDQGMAYMVPADNLKGYELHCPKYADSFPVYDLDFRNHDRYHCYTCSLLPKDLVRIPLINAASDLLRIAKIASFLRETDLVIRKQKWETLSYCDRELARDLLFNNNKATTAEEHNVTIAFLDVLENLINKRTPLSDISAVRHLALMLTDMEFSWFKSNLFFTSDLSTVLLTKPDMLKILVRNILHIIDSPSTHCVSMKMQHLATRPPSVCRTMAEEIIRNRLLFKKFESPTMRYAAEMFLAEEFFHPAIVRSFRDVMLSNDASELALSRRVSYEAWLKFRQIAIVPSAAAGGAGATATEHAPSLLTESTCLTDYEDDGSVPSNSPHPDFETAAVDAFSCAT